ncbi:MAG: 4-alpha-glucanotransferase [Treponema sp.]|nr:4-alpha-glucanotransferase [Treponema sp.]
MTQIGKLTGTAVPLGALRTEKAACIGEYTDLKKLADFAKKSGLGLIQLLPVNDSGTQSSPYSALSAFALHPIYLSLESIEGFDAIYKSNAEFKKNYDAFISYHKDAERFSYDDVNNSKDYFLRQIYAETETAKKGKASKDLESFIKNNDWVIPYAVYKNLKYSYMQASWKSWKKTDTGLSEEEIKKRWEAEPAHLYYAWLQAECEKQFSESVEYCRKNKILIKGDLPILMNEDSCDAWSHPEIFNQSLRAGSPADGENPTGQNWGFPTYNWKNLKADKYTWWKNRLINAAKFYDAYRLDHILGFFRIWAIPENDCNALNGHTEPFAGFKVDDLYELGFDDDRIRWLSVPHVPTHVIEDITWNHEKSHEILKLFATKLPGEELWLLDGAGKKAFGSKTIEETDLSGMELCTEEASVKIKEYLVKAWSDRTLIPMGKNKFVPSWIYGQSTSWGTLNDVEKEKLSKLFEATSIKENKTWEKNATEILSALTKATNMIPCGEDLGVGFECVPRVMKKLGILGLRVVRWCRQWDEEGQPYVPFEDYEPLSVCTTSVHDSSTMREWLESNKELYISAGQLTEEIKEEKTQDETVAENTEKKEKSLSMEELLKACKSAESAWFIPPLQDLLYMNEKYWKENAKDERINMPGSVNQFNWTYRIPTQLEELLADEELCKKIKEL